MTAELRGLRPGTLSTVHVLAGKVADATVLFTADFRTAAKKPFVTASSARTPLLIVTLGVLLFAIWRTRRTGK